MNSPSKSKAPEAEKSAEGAFFRESEGEVTRSTVIWRMCGMFLQRERGRGDPQHRDIRNVRDRIALHERTR